MNLSPSIFFDEIRYAITVFSAFFFVANALYKKRSNFVLRLLLSIVISLSIAISFVFFRDWLANLKSYGRYLFIAWYFFVAVIIFIGNMLIFKVPYGDGIFLFLGSYAQSHLTMVFSYELLRFTINLDVDKYLIPYILVVLLVNAVFLTIYVLLLKKAKKSDDAIFSDNKKQNIVFSIIFVLMFLVSLGFQFFFNLTTEVSFQVMIMVSDAFVCLFSIFVVILLVNVVTTKKTNDYLTYFYEKEKEQYQIFKGTVDYINIKFHDLKHQMDVLYQKGEINENSYKNIKDDLNRYSAFINTGNEEIDIILTDFSMKCLSDNISFSAIADGKLLTGFDEMEVYNLLLNIFTNAYNYVVKIKETENRYINFYIKNVHNFILIKEINYFSDELKLDENGLPKTSHRDKKNHGFGMKSMKAFVEKYQGQINVDIDSNEFVLTILIPLNK